MLGSESPRIRFIPLVRPDQLGLGPSAPVIGLACVFVDKVATDFNKGHGLDLPPPPWNVYVRLTNTCSGLAGGSGPILNALQIVE